MTHLTREWFRGGLFCLVLMLVSLPSFSASEQLSSKVETLNQECLTCHADSGIDASWSKKAPNGLYMAADAYHSSVHGNVPCIACHQSKPGSEGFKALPHEMVPQAESTCENCHAIVMHDSVHAIQQSVHQEAFAKETFTCTFCHDAHAMSTGDNTGRVHSAQVQKSNLLCTRCHSVDGVESPLVKEKGFNLKPLLHSSLPYTALHLKSLRCIDCHADINDGSLHRIMPASQAIGCKQCHGSGAPLTKRRDQLSSAEGMPRQTLAGKGGDDPVLDDLMAEVLAPQPLVRQMEGGWFTNSYMIGNNGSGRFDDIYGYLLAGFVGLLLCHGLGRYITRRAPDPKAVMEKHYLYTLPVRCWHWLNALCFVVLLVSGFTLHWGSDHLLLWVNVHNTAGLSLCAVWLGFVVVALCGNGHHYRVRMEGIVGRIFCQTRFYLYGIFRGEPHPEHASPAAKFNILQQMGYVGVMFTLLPLLIVTGLLMMYPDLTPEHILMLPGKTVVAYLHYGIALVMIMFIAVHLYLCSTGDTLWALLKGMLDGYHRTLKSPGAASEQEKTKE
ncbi:thiosulfate reductase cytochrome B subunit [Aeromonas sp. MdU4]|uniref:thiosulfate reductase cytochrome B subunit n=1 Tax=Aeromonas sp. MdU4 TaxID=3342819 RepID=UPI0035B99505